MFFMTIIILWSTFLNILVQIQSVTEFADVDDYDIAATEVTIRNTVNNIFSTLKLQDMKQNLKLKQYSEIHNFFASITLQDHNNLKEIVRISRVDNIDNGTQVFITQLNKVLNEDNKSDETTDDVYITNLIEDFLENLDNLKEAYGLKNSNTNFNINQDIIKHLSKDDYCSENITKLNKGNGSNSNVLSDSDFSKFNLNQDNITTSSYDNHYSNSTTKAHKGNESNSNILIDDHFWKPSISGRRVYEGVSVKIEKFPFLASVQFFKKFQCGGSIIKSDLVITSASCLQLAWNNRFFRENPAFLSVQVGSHYYQTGGENIPVVEIYFHPGYNPKNLGHNLAITRLFMQIYFNKRNKKVKKIDYDKNPWPMPENTDGITIIGWGARGPNSNIENPRKNQLSYAVLDFYPLRECQEVYTKEYVTNKHFCAGFFSKGGGACNRDAGGPGIHGGILYGVVSFGSPLCGAPDSPTVFTKLGYYNDWIEEIMSMRRVQIRQPTTLRQTKLFTFSIDANTRGVETATFKIEPIYDKPTDVAEESVLEEDALRESEKEEYLKKPEKEENGTVFKEFINTMFDSKELSDYLDQIQAKKGKHEQKMTLKKIVMKKIQDKNNYVLDPIPETKFKKDSRSKTKQQAKVITKKKSKKRNKKSHLKTISTAPVHYTALGHLNPYSFTSDKVTKVESASSLEAIKKSSIETTIQTSEENSINMATIFYKQNNHEKETTLKPIINVVTPLYTQETHEEPITLKMFIETNIKSSIEQFTPLHKQKNHKESTATEASIKTTEEAYIEAITPLKKQVNREEESTSSDEDNKFEEDILNLIDNLDIEEILESVESSSEDGHKKRAKAQIKKSKTSKSKFDEPLTKVASKIVDKLYHYIAEMKTKQKSHFRKRKNQKDTSANKNDNNYESNQDNRESKSVESIKSMKSNLNREIPGRTTNQDKEKSGTKEDDSTDEEENDNNKESENNESKEESKSVEIIKTKSKVNKEKTRITTKPHKDSSDTKEDDNTGGEENKSNETKNYKNKESENTEDSKSIDSNYNAESKEHTNSEEEEEEEEESDPIEINKKDDDSSIGDKETDEVSQNESDNQRYITLSVPVLVKTKNKNHTQKLFQMLYESDDFYQLIAKVLKNKKYHN